MRFYKDKDGPVEVKIYETLWVNRSLFKAVNNFSLMLILLSYIINF